MLLSSPEFSDDDPEIHFKNSFTADLTKCKEGKEIYKKTATALDSRLKNLKYSPKSERDEVWSMLLEVASECC